MKYYFRLQYRMLNRHLIDFGIAPSLAYFLAGIGFILGSHLLFTQFEFGAYLYVFFAAGLLLKLSNHKRNNFLKLSFTAKGFQKIRWIENGLSIIPFVFFLLYKQSFLLAFTVVLMAFLLSFLKVGMNFNVVIPTPFKKHPFEFIEGFRNTILAFPILYGLVVIGIMVNNFNLAIFSLIVLLFLSLSYYAKTENRFYVWLYKESAKNFLYSKIKRACIHFSWLTVPILVMMTFFFTANMVILIAFQLMAYVYIAQYILAKYSVFPSQMSLPTTIIFGLSLVFPPFVCITFGYFYKKAIQKLNTVLHD